MKWGKSLKGQVENKKGQWQNRWIKVLGSAVAAGIVYWYVTGEMDVWLYAISGGIGGIVFFEGDVGSPQKMAGIWWQEEKSRSGEDREESTEVDLSYQDWQQTTPENRWQVYPESEEAYRQELRREEEAQIERAREAGTTLLSASKNGGRNGALRAGGSRRNSDSDFPIFHLHLENIRGCRTHVLTVRPSVVFMRGSIRRRAYTF